MKVEVSEMQIVAMRKEGESRVSLADVLPKHAVRKATLFKCQ
jgi:hypothetical protein